MNRRGSSNQEPALLEPDWPAAPQVRAAFTLRVGGVSRPPFDTLNLGAHVGDAPEAVVENRSRVRHALGLPAEPSWLQQVHGATVVELSAAGPTAGGGGGPPVQADAAIARASGPVCAILVADCMPVLLAARDGSAVAAVHVGWRGLAAGVLEAAVSALAVRAPQLIAWMGPAIGAPHFEVGSEVRAALTQSAASTPRLNEAQSAFLPNVRGRWQCDLRKLVRQRLEGLGVVGVFGTDCCTFADRERFFSYRREGRCGRMAALIWLEE